MDDDGVYYGLGKKYGGDAWRFPGPKGRNRGRDSHRQKRKSNSKNRSGCIVCGKDHFARNNHSRENIIAAIRRSRNREPHRVFSVEDVCHIIEDVEIGQEDEDSEGSQDSADDDAYAAFCNIANSNLEMRLSNHRFISGSLDKLNRNAHQEMNTAFTAAEEQEFNGIIIDTGANRRSMMSLKEYGRYCKEFGVVANIDTSTSRAVNGLASRVRSIGSAVIPIPFKDLGVICDVEFHITQENCPSLLSLRDVKRNNLDVRLLDDRADLMGRSQPLIIEEGFLKHKWRPSDFDFAFITTEELQKLHRTFGHPSVNALTNLLKKARPDEMDADVKKAIQEIVDYCDTCQFHSGKPKRFKITVGSDELRFNHIVAVDVMYLGKRPVLHVVCESTHFCAARFMKRITADETWKLLRSCWMDMYLRPPDFLRVDQGSNFVSRKFTSEATACGISLLEAPIESPSTMSHVERYHHPLRAAYTKLRASLDNSSSDNEVLEMATSAVNNTVGPEGLCPTLLVFGTLPSPARTVTAPTQIQRALAMDAAKKAIEKEHAKRRIQFAKRYRGPYGRERLDLEKLAPGANVLVYRDRSKSWTGPFRFVSIDGDTVVVQEPSGRKIYRSHVFKQYMPTSDDSSDNSDPSRREADEQSSALLTFESNQMALSDNDEGDRGNNTEAFRNSRLEEIAGLQRRSVFKTVKCSSIRAATRIYRTKWVDLMKKQDDGSSIPKSRLVAQNFRDYGAANIATHSPTVTRLAQRLIMASAASQCNHKLFARDVSQAYVQSNTMLERHIFLEAPKEMELKDDEILQAVKPLYGIPESGLHWFATYHGHHIQKLQMQESLADRCLLFRHDDDGNTDGVVIHHFRT